MTTESIEDYIKRDGQIKTEEYFPDQNKLPDFPIYPKGRPIRPLENGNRKIPKYPAERV